MSRFYVHRTNFAEVVDPAAAPVMDAETFEALKVLMGKIDRHVRHASYQEDTKEAYSKVSEWMTRAGCQESEYES